MPTNNKVEPSKLEGLRIGWTCELACFKHALSHSNWQYLGIPLASVASRVLKTTLPSTAIFSNGCFIGASKRTCRTKFHRIGAKWRHTDCNLRNFSVESYIYIYMNTFGTSFWPTCEPTKYETCCEIFAALSEKCLPTSWWLFCSSTRWTSVNGLGFGDNICELVPHMVKGRILARIAWEAVARPENIHSRQ